MPDPRAAVPPLRLYDTRRRRVEPFVGSRTVRLYVCGITPYDSSHLGHAFTYSAFDTLVRVLEAAGHLVVSCRNVTDVDDDIIRTARERRLTTTELARREMADFQRQMDAIGLQRPAHEPRASDAIDAIVTAVEGLVRTGGAYVLDDGRVYLGTAIGGDAPFGMLADLDDDERHRRYAEAAGDPDAPGKHHPLDILLWQPPAADDEPRWPSPWGDGRPGWHIECSVMATETLGTTIDIHGGGRDLTFPHHEAEILQSERLTGQSPFARFWMHTGLVQHDGRTMAKSVGNLVYVDDLLADHPAGAVRRYLLEHHYREDWSFDATAMSRAADAWQAWRRAADEPGRDRGLDEAIVAALADDLDTPTAVERIDEAARRGAGRTVADGAALLGVALTPRT